MHAQDTAWELLFRLSITGHYHSLNWKHFQWVFWKVLILPCLEQCEYRKVLHLCYA